MKKKIHIITRYFSFYASKQTYLKFSFFLLKGIFSKNLGIISETPKPLPKGKINEVKKGDWDAKLAKVKVDMLPGTKWATQEPSSR